MSSEVEGTYSRAVRWGEESVGTAFVAVHGGGRKRGLVVVVPVVFILVACGSSWYVIVFLRVLGRARSSSFAFIGVRARCRSRSLSFAFVVVRARCRARLVSFACAIGRVRCRSRVVLFHPLVT